MRRVQCLVGGLGRHRHRRSEHECEIGKRFLERADDIEGLMTVLREREQLFYANVSATLAR
jgi:hypothetical protein